jgi:MFS family permease
LVADRAAAIVAARSARAPVALVTLLSCALLVNYVDRGSIAIAAPMLEKELGLSASEMGWVLAAFYWAYAPLQPVMGWLADRYGPARVLAGGVLLWSLATAASGFAGGVFALVLLRLLMGTGEATFYPSALSLLSRNVAPEQRARATATMQFGAVVGPAIGTLLGGLLMVRYGWRAMFIVLGLASMSWLLAWRRWMRTPKDHAPPAQKGDDPPYWLILRQRALWGGMLGTFCSNYAFYFVFSWLPLYLVHERGLSLTVMTQAASAFYVVDGASVLLAGWLLDRWIRSGASFNRAYKTALALSSAGVGACLIASSLASGLVAAAAILLLTGAMDGLNSPANPSVTQTFAGPWATGRWMGLQNAVGNVAGMSAPVVTGYLVQHTGHYTAPLIVSGVVALCGLVAWLVVVPEVRPIDWSVELAKRKTHATSS